METLQDSGKKKITINDLRQEVETWRKQKPQNKNVFIFIKDPIKDPIDFAGFFIFFIILAATFVFVPVFEIIRLLILRPALTLFHTTMVVIGAALLRVLAKPLIYIGNKSIAGKNRGIYKFIYTKGFPVFLRFFNLCFGFSLKYYLKIDTKDVRSIGKFQEWIDDTLGVEGKWVESDVNRSVRHETWCPFVGREIPYVSPAGQNSPASNGIEKPDYSEFCSYFMRDWLQNFIKFCNPAFELEPVTCMLPKGDECCEFVYKRKRPWKGEKKS
ncbi:MAG: hypothetical protein ACKVE4_06595 [Dissulfuribacterales bacterium]